ncbi:hypothetical protein QFZ65_003364 [Arthrobacter sp. B3I9]|uniref:hypothetical protein n=1 Tax=Arthrobacter sp. B3I9 TaxID=3042270 RepID=UPI00278EB938|nr:hypothetical protein [Arthrobacter sp. B3I9]MDQ0851426.1 hypothetical protein [Arthrobacter sp. B3I9]
MNLAKATPAAPKAPSALVMRLRGPLAVLVAVALMLGVPSLANAAFTSRTTATVSAGTYKIPAPASINGTLQCTTNGQTMGATIKFTEFAKVARATGYTATLKGPGGVATMPVAAGATIQMSVSGSAGTYTFSLVARVGSWTGTPLEQSVTC